MLDPLAQVRQTRPPLIREAREDQKLTTYAVECRLADRIIGGEELWRRLAYLDYRQEQDLHDLWAACRWADRIELCRERLARDREEIRRLWLMLWRWTAEALMRGEQITALDRFFFLARSYMEQLLAGRLTFAELDGGYDWKMERYKPEFQIRAGRLAR